MHQIKQCILSVSSHWSGLWGEIQVLILERLCAAAAVKAAATRHGYQRRMTVSAPGGDELSITINNAAGWMKQTGMASPTIPDKMGSGRSEDLCVRQG